jgi:hypothetical protein
MTAPAVELELDGGGQAEAMASDGDRVTLESTRPFPPGSTLLGLGRDGSGEYRIKVRGSRKSSSDAAAFVVEGRFVNLTRSQRALLLGRAASGSP